MKYCPSNKLIRVASGFNGFSVDEGCYPFIILDDLSLKNYGVR